MTPWSFRSRTLTAFVAVATVVLIGGVYAAAVDNDSGGSVFVPITPVRVLDTRIGAGLGDALSSDQPATLRVTGSIPTVLPGDVVVMGSPIPSGATGVVTNATVVGPTTIGYLAVRPGNATGEPATSSINFTSPGAIVPNAVTTELPTSGPHEGAIQLWFHGTETTAKTHVLVDVVGYFQPAATAVSPGPAGPSGPAGAPGVVGGQGPVGPSAQTIARIGQPISTTLLASSTPLAWTALALGSDGNPVVAVSDTDGNRLTAVACLDPKCSSHLESVVDPALDAQPATTQPGGFTSMAIGADGNPIIAYQSDRSVKVAACSSPTCAGAATISTVFPGPTDLAATSITIRPDGLPIVALGDFDGVASDLVVVSCTSPTCTTSVATVIPTGASASTPDVEIGAAGLPLIAYTDITNGDLDVFSCSSVDCSAGVNTTMFATGVTGRAPSMALGIDGNPVIAFRDVIGSTRVAACRNADCTAGADTRSVASYAATPDLVLDPSGRLVFSARSGSAEELHVVTCADAVCALPTNDLVLASGLTGNDGHAAAIVMGDDGNPVVAWAQLPDKTLRITVCGNPMCSPFVGVG